MNCTNIWRILDSDINLLEVGDILRARQADTGSDYNDDNGDENGDGILAGSEFESVRYIISLIWPTTTDSDDSLLSLGDILKRQADDGSDYNDSNGDDNGDGILAGSESPCYTLRDHCYNTYL